MKQRKLITTLSAIGLLTVALPIVVIVAISTNQSMESMTSLASSKMAETAGSLAEGLDFILREQILTVSNLSKFDSVENVLERKGAGETSADREEFFRVQKIFSEIKDSYGDRLSSLSLLGPDKTIILSSDNGKIIGLDLTGREYVDQLFKGKATVGSVLFSRATGNVICTAGCPVFNQSGDKILGGVIMGLQLGFISKIVEKINSGQFTFAYLVNEKGLYINHPDKDKIMVEGVSHIKEMADMLNQSKRGQVGFVRYELDGVKKLAAFAPIPSTGWTVVNSASLDELYASAKKTRNIIIGWSFLFLGLALAVFFFLAKSVAAPIMELAGASNEIGEGNLDITVKGEERQDEIGVLAKAFNNMTANIRQARKDAEDDNWLKSGITRLNTVLRGDPDIATLSSRIINELAYFLNAQVGAVYIMDDGQEPVLRLKGSFAYLDPDGSRQAFRLGQGMVGQSALEKRRIINNGVPEDHIKVVSGLGESSPHVLCVMPLLYDDRVNGVIELGMWDKLNELTLAYLDQAGHPMAIAVESAFNRAQLANALEKSQAFSEELQVQQEELRVSNEELEEQTELLKESESKLMTQQEELQAINISLEEKNDLLEQRKQEVEKAQQEVQKKAEEAKQVSKYKSEFLANMSHELRTPLNSLLLLAQALIRNKEGNLTPEQVESANIIYGSGSDLLSLINEILDLSKIEAGRMDIQPRKRSISDFVEMLQASFTHMAQEKGLDLETKIEPGTPQQVVTDPKRVDQILRNLVSNAMKFTETGSVTITFGQPASHVDLSCSGLDASQTLAISVTDTGIGIAPEDRERIFEAFKQADGGIDRKYGGTGLGLSISREMAQLLGGEIQLESEYGSGSTFTLYLPFGMKVTEPHMGEAHPQPACGSTPVSLSPGTENTSKEYRSRRQTIDDDRDRITKKDRVILVIEDDTSFARLILDACRERGFKCVAASNGEEGIDLAFQYIPDGVVLDIRMPGMDGWSVLDTLKNNTRTRHIPVHVISVEEAAQESLRKGAIGHATKPIGREELIGALEKLERISEETKKRVLLVEDDDLMRRSVKELIADNDVQVDEASTGAQAIDLMKANRYGCLILDIKLPDMNGFELLSKMGKEKLNIPPVVVHTSRELTEQEEIDIREHAESIVIKGVRSQERLLDEVSLFLHRMVGDLPEAKKQIIRSLHETDELLKDRKILVVDDDMRTTFALSRLLSDRGMIPLKAANGRQALTILDSEPDVDLVLMDIMMPVIDGYETMKRIREQERFRKLPIIALTAKAMPGDRTTCLEAGASDYLPKPLNQERLLSMMRIWLYR